MKSVYVIFEKRYFTDGNGGVIGIYPTKGQAMEAVRKGGWKWNSDQKIFLNDAVGMLRTVDCYPFGREWELMDADCKYDVK